MVWRFARNAVVTMLALAILPPHAATACSIDAIAAVIDATGESLRARGIESKSRVDAKIRAVAKKHTWPEAQIETRAAALVNDSEGISADEKAADLLMRLDRLGDSDEPQQKLTLCERLQQAESASRELLATTDIRTRQILARLDKAIGEAPTTPDGPSSRDRQASSRPAAKEAPKFPQSSAPQPWNTHELTIPSSTPPSVAAPPLDPTYSAEEIAAAGRGFFGTISSNLAAVIQYAVANYGRPNGYILGTEGSGAFIAGLRYGTGRLIRKDGSETTVHWQGPSIGYDVGVTGSRVMFLVYNIRTSTDVYRRFAGIDGSAYVVGGAGITFLKRGGVILAPIRTGLGLRVGANVGYLKFTPTPSLNPF